MEQELEQIKNSFRPRKSPQQYRAKETVEKILTAGRTLLNRDGPKGLTARRLAKECGLTTGAIYDHFPGISSVLYHLYEDRLNQELKMFGEVFGSNAEGKTIEQVFENFARADASLQWGSPLDIELHEAAKNDQRLKKLSDHILTLQRDLIVKAFKRSPHTATDMQLTALASYILQLNSLSFRLRHRTHLGEKKFILEITTELVKHAIQFANK